MNALSACAVATVLLLAACSDDAGPRMDAMQSAIDSAASEADAPTQAAACFAGSTRDYSVRLTGSGFDAYDGVIAYAYTEMPLMVGATCLATQQQTIRAGMVEFLLMNRTDSVYPYVGAFIDLDSDGRCTPGSDPVWLIVGSLGMDDISFTLMPSNFFTADADSCASLPDAWNAPTT